MAESNGSLWDQPPGPDWFPDDYLRETGIQTHQDYLPSLSRSLSEDFRNHIAGTRVTSAHEETRKIRGTRRGKKAHVTRLVNQINRHISKRLSKETLASLKLDLEKAVSQLENINQALFELNPDDDEPEYWMEGTLAPVYDCFDNIEMYCAERVTLESELTKEVEDMLVLGPLESSKENVDKSFSHDNYKIEAPVVQTSVVHTSSTSVHQPFEIGTSSVMQPPITTVENEVLNTANTSNLTTVPTTSCTSPQVSLTHPRTVTTVTDSISTPVACYKLPSNPDQISTSATQNSPWRGWNVPYQQPSNPVHTSTPATPNSPWRGWSAPSQLPSDLKQISTPATQDSPWRSWTVPNQTVSPRPGLPGTLQSHPRWGLVPDFPGPPSDAWIDQLDEHSVISQPPLTAHHHCSFSAMERSLPKFDLGKFDGSPLVWPLWIGRFKSIVHDQPFLNDSQRLAYLQNTVIGAAASEIQFLGEDSANYILALRMLKARFADSGKIVRAAITALKDTPSPRPQDHTGLTKLYQALRSTVVTLHRQRFVADLLSETNLNIAVQKLPGPLQSKWAMEVQKHESHGRPNLFDLDRWLSEQVRARHHLVYEEPAKCPPPNRRKPPRQDPLVNSPTLHIKGDPQPKPEEPTNKEPKSPSCPCCNQAHPLYRCNAFKEKSVPERYEVVKSFKVCFNCLKQGHQVNECSNKTHCQVTNCKRHHHSLLHYERAAPQAPPSQDPPTPPLQIPENAPPYVATTNSLAANERVVYFQVVPVQIQGENGVAGIETFAILDDGSSDTLIRRDIADKLNLEGQERLLCLGNIENNGTPQSSRAVNLLVTPTGKQAINTPIHIHPAWTVTKLNVPPQRLVKENVRRTWKHLEDLDIPAVSSDQIGLLIGVQVTEAMIQHESRCGPKGQPYAVRTDFGWAIAGLAGGIPSPRTNVGFVGHCVTLDTTLNQEVENWWKTESFGTKFNHDISRSTEDERALKRLEETTSFRADLGQYETGLLWKDEEIVLPNNRPLAEKRLTNLERSLDKDSEKAKAYYDTVDTYIAKDYARKLSPTEIGTKEPQNTWYLPHHAVTNPNKPGKTRVVFDAAASYNGTSLNDQLVTGPDLLNSLVGVIMRFRLHAVAMIADIEKMFLQVRVIEEDQPSLRFLWRGPDRDRPSDVYQMQAMIFGAKSSPTSANYCLRRTAIDNQTICSEETTRTVLRDFYMDDLLKSLPSEDETAQLALQLMELLSRGGFRLTKFMSNSRSVLAQLPSEDILSSPMISQPFELDLDSLPVERALGVLWNVEQDTLEIKVVPKQLAPTKRGILKQISTIFDPLGLVAPFVLRAKLILQELWRLGFDWDKPISGPLLDAWEAWKAELPLLATLSVPRCYLSNQPSSLYVSAQIHVFADASEVAFGAAAYWRFETQDHSYQSSLIFGKTRLAPIKPLTIPRLELQAAVMAVRMSQTIQKELDVMPSQITYWTDSTTVLSYIKSQGTRFHTFVANRVAEIKEVSDPETWRHVPGRLNVADDCSRGLSAQDLLQDSRWINGPNFLSQGEDCWPNQPNNHAPIDEDPEVKAEAWLGFSSETQPDSNFLNPRKTSSWSHLLRVTSWMFRFATRSRLKNDHTGPLSVEELLHAEEFWVKRAQAHAYTDDLTRLAAGKELHCSSELRSLCPHTDDKGILRVGGRLKHAPIPYQAKHPAILPKRHDIVPLILLDLHQRLNHSGVEHILAELRQRYWIPKVRSALKKIAKSCHVCRKHNAKPDPPLMASLPQSRLQAFTPPFYNTGVDYFGPLLVKERRSTVKRYGCLFTCLVTRAVHLQIAHSLETDSFIMALRRMMARRGKPRNIYSDNGTNFVGAERELTECLDGLDQAKISDTLSQDRIQWFFNPPSAPHFGGVWERLVKSAKKALKIILNGQLVNDETLLTVMVEVESLLNSRPLTHVSVDPQDLEPITPNHFLLGRNSPNMPPGVFDERDLNSRKRWRQAQTLTDHFWRRWLREYVPALTERNKWRTRSQTDVQIGDLVLVVEDNLPRGRWNLGRVVKTFPGDDGLIRTVEVQTKHGTFKRPVVKLCLLEEAEHCV